LKSFRGIFVIGEKNIFIELTQIIDIATEANTLVSSTFNINYEEKNLIEAMHTMQSLEKKSDDIAFQMSEDITSGAISPNIIDDLLKSVQVADDIVDLYYYLIREKERMSKVYAAGFESKRPGWDSVYVDTLALAGKTLLKLKQALSSSNVTEILELRKEIEALEEQGDDLKDAGFDRLYYLTPNLHYLQFYHYAELLHKCDDVLDSCQDLSDLIVAVVTSIIK
jgi:uncharacterized protein Yka (UPF0111/DUF47 family)